MLLDHPSRGHGFCWSPHKSQNGPCSVQIDRMNLRRPVVFCRRVSRGMFHVSYDVVEIGDGSWGLVEGWFHWKFRWSQIKECTNTFKGEAQLSSVESHNVLFGGYFLCGCIMSDPFLCSQPVPRCFLWNAISNLSHSWEKPEGILKPVWKHIVLWFTIRTNICLLLWTMFYVLFQSFPSVRSFFGLEGSLSRARNWSTLWPRDLVQFEKRNQPLRKIMIMLYREIFGLT